MIDTYMVRRRARIGATHREADEPAPEAHLWRLTEGLVRSGTLREVQMTEAEFAAAVAKYCPEDTDEIFAKLGMEAASFAQPKPGRQPRAKKIMVSAPTLIDDQE